jgi:excisionase family DNA binding protein
VAELPDPQMEPTVSVERAGALLGICRATAYQAVRTGEIPAIRIGRRRVVVPTAALLRLLCVEQP